ncbi:helix-turn-helix domain-containing protein [Rhodopseudomonas palustris]|uniref:helix-turn-helix domain-containing protein n=1 Tax=Rhodopseudomonas palustris TaxID=1076 RepID=UPI0020CDB4C6|nr:helix-turn-helix domain-containing protein [Rhodopseudomonas palustris]MCP9630428.1 helix-turn-helix domain-containing protein [Rhodopseudomonas palustris]
MQSAFAPQPHRTVESFQSGVRQVCGTYTVRTARAGQGGEFPFAARTGLLRGEAGAELAYVRLAGVEVERTAAQIRADFVDHFVLTMQCSGSAEMTQGGATALLRPRDIFVSDATRPSRFSFAGDDAEQISLHIARSEGMGRLGKLLDGPTLIRGDSGFAVALKVLMLRLARQIADAGTTHASDAGGSNGRIEDDASTHLHEALFAVLASALLEARTSGYASRDTYDRLYDEALCIIHRHASDPAFGAGEICRELGISPRQLQRSFARHGDSAREQILTTRLERARRRILNDQALTVSEIAYSSGFNDLSFFYRAYRRHFGAAPGERR